MAEFFPSGGMDTTNLPVLISSQTIDDATSVTFSDLTGKRFRLIGRIKNNASAGCFLGLQINAVTSADKYKSQEVFCQNTTVSGNSFSDTKILIARANAANAMQILFVADIVLDGVVGSLQAVVSSKFQAHTNTAGESQTGTCGGILIDAITGITSLTLVRGPTDSSSTWDGIVELWRLP